MIVSDAKSDLRKCYGFVDMQGIGGARDAIAALNGAKVEDRVISVRIKEDKEPRQQPVPLSKNHAAQAPKIKRPRLK